MSPTISGLVLGLLASTHYQIPSAVAFVAPNVMKAATRVVETSPSIVVVDMVGDEFDFSSDETNEIRVEPDTHDELMYALGVNLARQLGDIRPLVESGEELAQVAKGLLDTVVGRLNDDGQRLLLSKRGQELDQLIAGRA